MKGDTLFGALVVVLMRGWTALEASARSWRSLDEEVRTASFLPFFLLTVQESPQQRAESGSRALPRRGGPGDGLGRSGGTCALVAVAGRGGEELFSPFVTRSRCFLLRGARVAVLWWNN
jgi:hypothetical protein